MASEPMTLGEFEREAVATLDSAVGWAISRWEAQKQMDALRPLLLRLLAGERERCARTLIVLQQVAESEGATRSARALHYGIEAVRAMGDQT